MERVQIIRTREELETLRGAWNTLVERCARPNVFLAWEWVSNWIDVYLGSGRLLVIVLRENGEPRAIAPLCVQEERLPAGMSFKALRFLGSGEACADHLDVIVAGGSPGECARWIWDALFGALRAEWDVFEYYDAREDSAVLDAFRAFAREDKRCVRSEPAGESVCPYLDLPRNWEEFLERCGGSRRYTITYSMRKLAEQGRLEKRFCRRPEDLDGCMDAFVSLHQTSWNERGQPGAFSSPKFETFHRRVARDLLAAGSLFLCAFHLDGRHIGSFYGFEYRGTLSYYLLGVETNPVKRVKTGTAVIGHCIEEAIRRGCTEFDFLRGAEEYKYRWTSSERRDPSVRFYNRTGRAAAYLARNASCAFVKKTLKILLGRHAARLKTLVRR